MRIAILLLVLILPTTAFALAMDHGPGSIPSNPQWPASTLELANSRDRVAGHWVNQSDSFYYQGDVAALNEFLKRYGQVDDTPLSVVLHAGQTPLTGKLGEPANVPFNWMLQVTRRGWGEPKDPRRSDKTPGYVVTVHAWLGNGITLDELTVPPHIDVKSAKDIERFIERHRNERTLPPLTSPHEATEKN